LPAASGWRLETTQKCDKKKSELYFCTRTKKFLTEKRPRAVLRFFPRDILSNCFLVEIFAGIFAAEIPAVWTKCEFR
jgi:hypothetical protein